MRRLLIACAVAVATVLPVGTQSGAAVVYQVTFPEPAHHWAQVDVTFPNLGDAPLRVRMSRSSPGRYAVHEFAKNIFAIDARDDAGRPLALARTGADQWEVARHGSSVHVVYRIFGDFADGTYLAVDTTHAHLNMPATFLWALGLDDRPIRITFVPPAGSRWEAGTQLYPTARPFTFTAPNLQYFMDSPTELAPLVTSTFSLPNATGTPARFRVMVHADARQTDVDALAASIRRVVGEQEAIFGAFPAYEPGVYTFLIDDVPWAQSDAMEHRNSTYISLPGVPLGTAGGRAAALESVSHEFFHNWNVERIRPAGLEPFDFTRENVTCCLWLAEGFTEYYGPLTLQRAGLGSDVPLQPAVSLINSPARHVRSAVEMSEEAPFADAAVANDVDDRSRTFLSYYTEGAAIALGLDLSLRERSQGRISLDDYMRRLWNEFGAPPAPRPGYVAHPYTLADLRRALATVSGDPAFADEFFDRYIEGRKVPDYAHLLGLAGYALRRRAPDRGWAGDVPFAETTRGLLVGGNRRGGSERLVPFGTPAYDAGVDAGDLIVSIDGQAATAARWAALADRTPGGRVSLVVERRDGTRVGTVMTLVPDPALDIVPAERLGTLTDSERAFRHAWLGATAREPDAARAAGG